jgi:hypothetical protein
MSTSPLSPCWRPVRAATGVTARPMIMWCDVLICSGAAALVAPQPLLPASGLAMGFLISLATIAVGFAARPVRRAMHEAAAPRRCVVIVSARAAI